MKQLKPASEPSWKASLIDRGVPGAGPCPGSIRRAIFARWRAPEGSQSRGRFRRLQCRREV